MYAECSGHSLAHPQNSLSGSSVNKLSSSAFCFMPVEDTGETKMNKKQLGPLKNLTVKMQDVGSLWISATSEEIKLGVGLLGVAVRWRRHLQNGSRGLRGPAFPCVSSLLLAVSSSCSLKPPVFTVYSLNNHLTDSTFISRTLFHALMSTDVAVSQCFKTFLTSMSLIFYFFGLEFSSLMPFSH